MFAPQFSLRKLIGMVTASGLVCLMAAAMARGSIWAAAVLVALFGLAIALIVYGLLYAIVMALGSLIDRRRASKFAAPEAERPAG